MNLRKVALLLTLATVAVCAKAEPPPLTAAGGLCIQDQYGNQYDLR